jgi:hypothetical protein
MFTISCLPSSSEPEALGFSGKGRERERKGVINILYAQIQKSGGRMEYGRVDERERRGGRM